MELIVILSCIILIIFNVMLTKKIISIENFFIGFWALIIFLIMVDSKELKVSNYVYFLVIIFLLSFFIGNSIKKMEPFKIIKINKNEQFYIDSKIYVIISIIALIILLYFYNRFINLVELHPTLSTRTIKFQNGLLFRNTPEYLFFNWVLESVIQIQASLSVIVILYTKKITLKKSIPIFNIIINSLIGEGRMQLFQLILIIIMLLFLFKYTFESRISRLGSKSYLLYFLITIILILTMTKLTLLRLNIDTFSWSDIVYGISFSFDQTIDYFKGPLVLFDHFVHNKRTIYPGFLFGGASISGFLDIILLPLDVLGQEIILPNQIIGEITSPSIFIPDLGYFNAFYTGLFNGYLDAGIVGVALLGFILGSILNLLMGYLKRIPSLFSLAAVLQFTVLLFSTTYRFNAQSANTYIIIFCLIMMSKSSKSNN